MLVRCSSDFGAFTDATRVTGAPRTERSAAAIRPLFSGQGRRVTKARQNGENTRQEPCWPYSFWFFSPICCITFALGSQCVTS